MIRRIAAIVLALHGAIHLIGFVTPWRIATLEGFAYRTTVFNGALDVRDAGARVIGLAWLGLTVGFLTAGYGVWRGTRWAVGLTGVLAVVSLVVCLLGLPETFAGIAINVVILAMVACVVFVRDRAASQLG
jgi:peptidoglycan/LPS O-acetylase OafA/YrhL